MECPKCNSIMMEDPDVGLATCLNCDHVMELGEGAELPKPMGRAGSVPTTGTMTSAWRVYRSQAHRFMGIWAIPALLGFIMTFFVLTAQHSFLTVDAIPEGQALSLTGVYLLAFFLPLVVNIFFSAAVIRMAADVYLHGETTISSGLSVLGGKLPALLAISAIFALPLIAGEILCYGIPTMICCYWWMFSVVILVVEGAEVRESLALSREFATSRASFMFALFLMLLIGLMVRGILFMFPPVSSMLLVFAAPEWFTPFQFAITNAIILAIVEWLLYPMLIVAVVAFYLSGRDISPPGAEGKEDEGKSGEGGGETEGKGEEGDGDDTSWNGEHGAGGVKEEQEESERGSGWSAEEQGSKREQEEGGGGAEEDSLASMVSLTVPPYIEPGMTEEIMVRLNNHTDQTIKDLSLDLSNMAEFFDVEGEVIVEGLEPEMELERPIRIKPKYTKGSFPVKMTITGDGVSAEKRCTIKVGGTEVFGEERKEEKKRGKKKEERGERTENRGTEDGIGPSYSMDDVSWGKKKRGGKEKEGD